MLSRFKDMLSGIIKPVFGYALMTVVTVLGFIASLWLLREPTVNFGLLDEKAFGTGSQVQIFASLEAAIFMLAAAYIAYRAYWRFIAPVDSRRVTPPYIRLASAVVPVFFVYLFAGLLGLGQRHDVFQFYGTLLEFRRDLGDVDQLGVADQLYAEWFNQMVYVLAGVAQAAIIIGLLLQVRMIKLCAQSSAPTTPDSLVASEASETTTTTVVPSVGESMEVADDRPTLKVV